MSRSILDDPRRSTAARRYQLLALVALLLIFIVLLESGLELAHKLKLKSVAEGVETQQDWNLLKELGCDIAQGYLVAKPLPANEVKDWYGKWIA